ncbi:hypothetical protein [Pedobacter deserti]|uniref:hypothetical protein n=1 Tax=Pedobacter deserti TaxID=2817382 RepID=UPI002109A370|nr:hypothetical protein [Pedobacter sp. SYSU D00382]
MEPLSLDELNSLRGGYGGYYGYDSWDEFLEAVDSGDVEDGVYYNIDTSLPSGDSGAAGSGGSGGSGGFAGGPSDPWTLTMVDGQLAYQIGIYSIPSDSNGLCAFGAVAYAADYATGQYLNAGSLFQQFAANGGTVQLDPYAPSGQYVVTGVATSSTIISNMLTSHGVSNTILNSSFDTVNFLNSGGKVIVGQGSHTVVLTGNQSGGYYPCYDPILDAHTYIQEYQIDWSLRVGVNQQ